MSETSRVCVYHGEELAGYGFERGHPFGRHRLGAFWEGFQQLPAASRVEVVAPVMAAREDIERFHTAAYVELVERLSATGQGLLDMGDTPAFRGMFEASSFIVGSALDAIERLMSGRCRRAFLPIGGLHHARRDRAGGFCVFNDCGVVVEVLRARHGVRRVAYVDIDAHHGDGVFYGFEDDPDLVVADLHEDGRFLFPGTGWPHESGTGEAEGTKLNLPLPPGADDRLFRRVWELVEEHLDRARPEIILLQCGADGLEGDPLTHLRYTASAHLHAAARLCRLADAHCGGRILAFGGGGYANQNLVAAWSAVIQAFVDAG